MGDLDWDSDMVLCPECEAAQGDLWEHEFGSREEIVTSCGECGKDYVLHLRVSHKYAASLAPGPATTTGEKR